MRFEILGANACVIWVTQDWVWVRSESERGGHLLFHSRPEPFALKTVFGHCIG